MEPSAASGVRLPKANKTAVWLVLMGVTLIPIGWRFNIMPGQWEFTGYTILPIDVFLMFFWLSDLIERWRVRSTDHLITLSLVALFFYPIAIYFIRPIIIAIVISRLLKDKGLSAQGQNRVAGFYLAFLAGLVILSFLFLNLTAGGVFTGFIFGQKIFWPALIWGHPNIVAALIFCLAVLATSAIRKNKLLLVLVLAGVLVTGSVAATAATVTWLFLNLKPTRKTKFLGLLFLAVAATSLNSDSLINRAVFPMVSSIKQVFFGLGPSGFLSGSDKVVAWPDKIASYWYWQPFANIILNLFSVFGLVGVAATAFIFKKTYSRAGVFQKYFLIIILAWLFIDHTFLTQPNLQTMAVFSYFSLRSLNGNKV